MSHPVLFVCVFTFLIHVTESLAYCMRLAGVKTKKIAIALSFVTSTLLVSRLSNMFQAPLLGSMVDKTTKIGTDAALYALEMDFRVVIFAAFLGSAAGAFLGPTVVNFFSAAITHFQKNGSVPRVVVFALKPRNIVKMFRSFRLPTLSMLSDISLKNIPKQFLIINVCVTSIYTIGVLCSLLAGAYLPELRSTASQLSGIVNGLATIMFTLFVDPSGARITDGAVNGERPVSDVKSVVFFLQMGRIFGTLILSQLLFKPFAIYIMWATKTIGHFFV
jgi:hypothetical protein